MTVSIWRYLAQLGPRPDAISVIRTRSAPSRESRTQPRSVYINWLFKIRWPRAAKPALFGLLQFGYPLWPWAERPANSVFRSTAPQTPNLLGRTCPLVQPASHALRHRANGVPDELARWAGSEVSLYSSAQPQTSASHSHLLGPKASRRVPLNLAPRPPTAPAPKQKSLRTSLRWHILHPHRPGPSASARDFFFSDGGTQT